MPGDVDGNGAVDLVDARLVTRYVANEIATLPHPENADATQDGRITVEDALAIAQYVNGRSRTVVVKPENGLPGQAVTGALMRVEVTERFFPFRITGGTVRIRSASAGYDSGDQPLAFERDGRSLYYHWSTAGLKPATDYEVSVSLSESGRVIAAGMERAAVSGFSLQARSFEIPFLADVVDASAPGAGFPLEFRRVVPNDSAHAPYLGPLGRGWMLNYDAHLQEYTDGRIAFLGPDGFNRWFTSNADGTYTSSPSDYGVLTRDPDGTFQIREKDGFVFRFRADLRLSAMQDANGNGITAVYNTDGRLTEVQHTGGESFRLEYNAEGRIAKLTDHAGRETTYRYDAQGEHLLSVTAPGDRVTSYTYSLGQGEARDHRLTSITHPDGTHEFFEYDAQGRLISGAGDQGAGMTRLTYDADGTTHIADALGNTTTVRVNDQLQPVEIVDPLGATTCYEYDSQSRLVRVTDALSHTYQYGYDNLGLFHQRARRQFPGSDRVGAVGRHRIHSAGGLESGGRALSFVRIYRPSVAERHRRPGRSLRRDRPLVAGGWEAHVKDLPFNDFEIVPNEGYFVKCTQASGFIPSLMATHGSQPARPAEERSDLLPEVGAPVIENILVTNRRDVSLVVTWQTDESSDGWIEYGESEALGLEAYDDRGQTTAAQTHQVTLGGLKPETSYFFRIHSGSAVADDAGVPFHVMTRATGKLTTPFATYGQVFDSSGGPATGALVIVRLTDSSGNPSEPLSVLVNGWGWWVLSPALEQCEGMMMALAAKGADGSAGRLSVPACQPSPLPTITLGSGPQPRIYLPVIFQGAQL